MRRFEGPLGLFVNMLPSNGSGLSSSCLSKLWCSDEWLLVVATGGRC